MTHLIAEIVEGPAHPNLWNPTILGVLVVLSAIGLFCGSAYLLLATNLGGRLGFLVAFASLTGFMVLLSSLWLTSGNSGIDPPHGHSPSWKVVEVVSSPSESKIPAVRDIEKNGTAATEVQLGNLRPAMDAALVTAAPIAGVTPPDQPFAKFKASLDYLTDFPGYKTWIIGGGTNNLFWHHHKYAAVRVLPGRGEHAGRRRARLRPAARHVVRHPDLQLRLSARAGGVPVLDPFNSLVRPVAARAPLVRDRRTQAQEGRARTGAGPDAGRLGGRMVLAQQLIDASKDGGAAFLAFAIMVFLFAGSLFYMDKVRRRREERGR